MNKLFLFLILSLLSFNTKAQIVGEYKVENKGYFYDYYIFVVLKGINNDTLYALSPCFCSEDSIKNSKRMEINNSYEIVLLKINSGNRVKFKDKPPLTPGAGYSYDGKLINIEDSIYTDLFLILNACGEYILPLDTQLLQGGTIWNQEKSIKLH